jgi:nucleoporin NUP82
MVGLISFTSTVLGYGLIALASTGQVAAIELGDPYEVPVDESEHASILIRSDTASAEDTHCLLLANTFDFPKALDALKPPSELPTARSALDKLPTARKPVTSISSETTRAIITHISALHHYIQAIRTESMALERHLDLQVKEYQRQLHSLKLSSERVKELQERQIDKRVAKLAAQQEALGKRTERVMKSMQEDLKPKAGPKEKRWFKELSDLEGKVKGKSGFGMVREVPLEQRVRVVSPVPHIVILVRSISS